MFFSTLLIGHTDTITQVKWNTSCASTLLDDDSNNMSSLLSSMDKSLLLWYPNAEQQAHEQENTSANNCWATQTRVNTLNADIDGGSLGNTTLR